MRVLSRTSRNEVPLQLPLFSPLGLPVGPQSVLHLLGDGAGFRLGPFPSGIAGGPSLQEVASFSTPTPKADAVSGSGSAPFPTDTFLPGFDPYLNTFHAY